MEITKIQLDFEKVGATKSLVFWRKNMSWAIATKKVELIYMSVDLVSS